MKNCFLLLVYISPDTSATNKDNSYLVLHTTAPPVLDESSEVNLFFSVSVVPFIYILLLSAYLFFWSSFFQNVGFPLIAQLWWKVWCTQKKKKKWVKRIEETDGKNKSDTSWSAQLPALPLRSCLPACSLSLSLPLLLELHWTNDQVQRVPLPHATSVLCCCCCCFSQPLSFSLHFSLSLSLSLLQPHAYSDKCTWNTLH